MKVRARIVAGAAGLAAFGCLGLAGTASAAFPNFSDCPVRSSATLCIDVQSSSGSMTINSTTVPLNHSLEIRGGLDTNTGRFIPPTGTNGFFATPVSVPGGLLGIKLPIPGNAVTATAELAGNSSNIHIDPTTLTLSVPIKLELSNPLIGPACQVGSNFDPANLNLITGTTNPPRPNRPISGTMGTFASNDQFIGFLGNVNVDNSFRVPAANSCGFFPIGVLVDGVVDLRLGLPSSGGHNSISVANDVAIRATS